LIDLLYALAVLGAFALAAGGLFSWKRDRKRAVLLLGVAAVTLGNVWSWSTLPEPQGVEAPPAG
jgi:hypothetical protein